ncbi:nickel-dependent hydrogenase large subunit [Acidithiobacillus caldus]|uniref:nickel-dependent hydrogenase large subunit n=1 Tax=Acidithiobacillus caldus TaxID=33059 RepID=UPI001C060974|nr:nickel-dependent hydrogenase large subunit [Acidithiobacillus caldus]MBU2730745.1 nickel-dependent hydrogenase large subunit [Acidithiobacillus caldus]MBU2735724.1 nickel-dependent hydrogenase large subunit [Acidithiobacillus caldus ATCC 51756]MBU2744694.1 nickel-dependent hydrogenase large subunit [Acidithiobacillus caldus]MBU2779136.1 nickel-dependent hydrogenase large subunit [Acidithiobacillus caldus]
MATAVETLDISPVGRVEGDLDVRVDIRDGVVVEAYTQAELFRGFEVILRDKDPQAGLVVTPRACGICGASHLTCAAWALDTAWKTQVPRNAILARNIGQLSESLQSIPRHHYGLFMIDAVNENYRHSKYYEEAVKRYAPFTGKSYEIGVTISGKPVEIYALFGGQWPHSSYMVPGGVMCSPTLSDITRSWSILEYFRTNWLEPVWLGCSMERYEAIKSYDDFMAWLEERPEHANSDLGMYYGIGKDIGLTKFGAGLGKYITWGYLPDEDRYQRPTIETRQQSVYMKAGVYDAKTDKFYPVDQGVTRESTTHGWYDEGADPVHPFNRTTRPMQANNRDFNGAYSWCTEVAHEQLGRLEAGPLSRELIAGGNLGESWQHSDPLVLDMYKKMGPSVWLRHFARMHEACKIYRRIEHCLREFRLDEPFYIKPKEQDGQGWGATEAIRGALAHWIEIKGGKISNYQIIAPTTWNVGPHDARGERGPIEEALIGTPIQNPADPVEVGHVARSFDSCLVCTVHAHDAKTGKELARFRTA